MSGLKYFFKTPLRQQYADWKEYKDLCRRSACAIDKVGEAKSRISHMCTPDEKLTKGYACITYKLEPTEDAKALSLVTVYCPDFYEGTETSLCEHLHCPYGQKNREYHCACADSDALRVAKQTFWAKKFAKVK